MARARDVSPAGFGEGPAMRGANQAPSHGTMVQSRSSRFTMADALPRRASRRGKPRQHARCLTNAQLNDLAQCAHVAQLAGASELRRFGVQIVFRRRDAVPPAAGASTARPPMTKRRMRSEARMREVLLAKEARKAARVAKKKR